MKRASSCIRLALAGAALAASCAQAAQTELYESGPAEDSSFLRFVNASEQPLEIAASGSSARITLAPQDPASDFMPVRANATIRGTLRRGEEQNPVSLDVQPGQFATVVGLGTPLAAEILREEPDDFNALKASLGFYVLDASCRDAALLAAPRGVPIFENAARGSVQRRVINPVALAVQLRCGGEPTGAPLDLGTLAAGERYTVFLVPGSQGPRLFGAVDSLAR